MKKAVRWGMLSTSRINHRIAPVIRESPISELVGIASRELHKAKRAAKELGAVMAFGSYEEMLASDEIDAVHISVPNSLHSEWTVKAAESGKHVLCEKPLAYNAEEAKLAVNACERNGVLLMEGFMYRHHPRHTKVRKIISSGMIGEPIILNARYSDYRKPSDAICWRGELGGGALMHLGCYCLDVSRLIFESKPVSAKAAWSFDQDKGVDVTTVGLLGFSGERYASITCSIMMFKVDQYKVIGTEGVIEVPAAFQPGHSNAVIKVTRSDRAEEITVPGANQYRLEVEHFSRCILEESPLTFPAENGLDNMITIDMIKNSIDEPF